MLRELGECQKQHDVGGNIGYPSTFAANEAVETATHDYPKNADEKKNVGCLR